MRRHYCLKFPHYFLYHCFVHRQSFVRLPSIIKLPIFKKEAFLDQTGVHNCILTMLNDNVIDQQTKHATSVSFILYKILIELIQYKVHF